MKFFSMFSGIGGFDLALNREGHTCIGYSEIDKYAIQTYEKNFGREVKNYGDATKINPLELPDFDLLCGGFPCQAFSIAGKRRGFEDTRGTLFFEVARILQVKKPKLVLLENVKGLLNHNEGQTFAVILQTLEELGYDIQWMVLNSRFFGVAQNRERVFIIGSLRGQSRPEVLFKRSAGCEVVSEKGLVVLNEASHSNNRVYSSCGLSPTLNTMQGGLRQPKIITYSLYPRSSKTNKGGTGLLSKNDDSSYCLDTGNNQAILQTNIIRKLTPLECERLQGFPDDWTMGVSDSQRYRQLGNAVTVNVVQAIIKKLK